MANQSSGTLRTSARRVRFEHVFDERVEQAADPERVLQARVGAAGFDRVDGLARDAEALREIRLRPVALGAEDAEAVFHGCRAERSPEPVTSGSQTRFEVMWRRLRMEQ
jgi:hypothetical protein